MWDDFIVINNIGGSRGSQASSMGDLFSKIKTYVIEENTQDKSLASTRALMRHIIHTHTHTKEEGKAGREKEPLGPYQVFPCRREAACAWPND